MFFGFLLIETMIFEDETGRQLEIFSNLIFFLTFLNASSPWFIKIMPPVLM